MHSGIGGDSTVKSIASSPWGMPQEGIAAEAMMKVRFRNEGPGT